MKSLKNIYFSENFYIRNKIYLLSEAIITQKDFLGRLVKQIKERPTILGIAGVNTEQDIYNKLEENYSKKSDDSNKTKSYYYKLYIENYINSKEKDDSKVDKELVDAFKGISDLGEKFNRIYERLSSKEYFEKKYREKIEKLESDRVKRVEMLSKKGVKIPVNDFNPIEFNEQQFDKEWDIESRLFVIEGNIGLEIFKVVELFNILEISDKKSEKSAEEILQKQLKKYEGLDGGSIEFREIKKLYDYIDLYIRDNVEVDVGQCIEFADFYLRTVYIGLDEEEKKLIDSGEFDFSEIMQRMYHYNKYKYKLSSDKFSLYKDCELIYEDENFILTYPKSSFAFNDILKHFNAKVTWCTQNVTTWLSYTDKQFICILNDKRLKPGDENYLISFKVAKFKETINNSENIILYDHCCNYNNDHMSYKSINELLGSKLNNIKNLCLEFSKSESSLVNKFDDVDFIENSLESFVKMNRIDNIFKLCYEICFHSMNSDIWNYEEFIIEKVIKNIFFYTEQQRKLGMFYEITNKLFISLTFPIGLYIKLHEMFKSINKENVFISLVNNLLSMCKISNIHANYFITYRNIYELMGGNVNITYEDKIIIFSNALKTNNIDLFKKILNNINKDIFFVEEFKDKIKQDDIIKLIYESKSFTVAVNKIFTDAPTLVNIKTEIGDLSKLSFEQLIYYICLKNKNEIIEFYGVDNENIQKINLELLKKYILNNRDFINNFDFYGEYYEGNIVFLDIIKKCIDSNFNNHINKEFNKLKDKIINNNILIIKEDNDIENIFNNIDLSLLFFEDFALHQFINKIFNNKTILNIELNESMIKKIHNSCEIISGDKNILFNLRKNLNTYSDNDMLIYYQFLLGYMRFNLDDIDIKNNISHTIVRYYYMKNSSQIKAIKQEIFSSFNNDNIRLFDFIFSSFNCDKKDKKHEIYSFLNDVINVMKYDQTEKEFFEKFFIECFNHLKQCKELLMDLNNNINKFDSKNFEYFINFVNNDIINKVKTENLIKTYIKLLLN